MYQMINRLRKMIKGLLLYILVLFLVIPVSAQEKLTIEDCYQLAQQNYPLIKKQNLIDASREYSLSNVSKLYLPQFSISGQATFQSETMSFKDALPAEMGANIPELSKDQYKVQAEINQLIFDGGQSNSKKALLIVNSDIQSKQLEVNLYSLKARINQIYFSILLMEDQLKQNELRKIDLQLAIDKITAALNNGTAFRSNVNELKAEMTSVESLRIELNANQESYLQMLSAFTGSQVTNASLLVKPTGTSNTLEINRPELSLFATQKKLYDVQERQLRSEYLPKLGAFFQGAYGRPTLNIIKDQADFWYLGGVRVSWSFGSLYTIGNQRKIINLSKESLEVEQQTFLFNTNLELRQQSAQVKKYQDLILEDSKAVELRTSVTQSAKAQLDNGVITARDFISQLNAENLARQTKILHEIQLLQAIYELKNTTGN